jgi:uncharacterized RDD family membrane protein YckC
VTKQRPERNAAAPRRRLAALCGALLLSLGPAQADELLRPNEQTVRLCVAADEQRLWIAVARPGGSVLYRRRISAPFDLGQAINRSIRSIAPFDTQLLVVFEDGSIYRYDDALASIQPETVLPLNERPLDIIDAGDGIAYALVNSSAAVDLPRNERLGAGEGGAVTTGASSLSVVAYDQRNWTFVGACPVGVKPAANDRLGPRLAVVQDALALLWCESDTKRLHWATWDRAAGWRQRPPLELPGKVAGFWFTVSGRVPTIVASIAQVDGTQQVHALRLLGDIGDPGGASWRSASLQLSEPPPGVVVREYAAASGFNQHVLLLALDEQQHAHLLFARPGEAPTEPSVALEAVFAQRGVAQDRHELIQTATFAVVLLVMVGLFALRRGSLLLPAELPPGYAPALAFQRLAGWLIDFVPFTIASALALNVEWRASVSSLMGWVVAPASTQAFPAMRLLLWWGLSCAAYTAYCVALELTAGRTIGKMVVRTYICSDRGQRPAVWQTLVRNLFRPLELVPQLWIFALLIAVSRNRQRLGDIFARTVVIRGVASADAGDQDHADHSSD